MTDRPRPLVLILLLTALLAACGGAGQPDAQATTADAPADLAAVEPEG